jgi:hypothetical protein
MPSPRDPELDVAAGAMVRAGARFVVIGGFAVIANRFVRPPRTSTSLSRSTRQTTAESQVDQLGQVG